MAAMAPSSSASLWLVPGRAAVLFLVQVEQGPLVCLSVRTARFLDGLNNAVALLGFSAPQRADWALDELLPWAGNV
jgi:hypothetical protein